MEARADTKVESGRPAGVGAGVGWAVFILLALLGPLAGCQRAAPVATPAALPVRVETVHLVPGDEVFHYAAVIRPRFESDLGFRVGGKIMARLVDVGARVEPGMALAQLDPVDLNLRVRAAEAQLAAARAEAAQTRADFARVAQLRQDNQNRNDGKVLHHQEADHQPSNARGKDGA